MVSSYPTSTSIEGINAREKLFEIRLRQSAALSKFFHFTLQDIDSLSIEEIEMYLAERERIIKEMK